MRKRTDQSSDDDMPANEMPYPISEREHLLLALTLTILIMHPYNAYHEAESLSLMNTSEFILIYSLIWLWSQPSLLEPILAKPEVNHASENPDQSIDDDMPPLEDDDGSKRFAPGP